MTIDEARDQIADLEIDSCIGDWDRIALRLLLADHARLQLDNGTLATSLRQCGVDRLGLEADLRQMTADRDALAEEANTLRSERDALAEAMGGRHKRRRA